VSLVLFFVKTRRQFLFQYILYGLILAILVGEPLLLWKPFKKLTGKGLNGRAWRASYTERHQPVPPAGAPREGFWGVKLLPVPDPHLGLILPERHVPDMFDIDRYGCQYAFSAPRPKLRILIVGGSVAAGAYASNLHRTYFKLLAGRLGRLGHRVEIVVQATGGWTSKEELNAFKYRINQLDPDPDFVIFLDGLNDVTLYPQFSEERRVRQYLGRMREARDFALANHIKVIFSPQPFLPEKETQTGLERLILAESYHPLDELVKAYTDLRMGLQRLCMPGKVFYMDCSDAFANRPFTTFADIWHFGDPGHNLLAREMALKLEPLLHPEEVRRKLIPVSKTARLQEAQS
jgi:lysophospholipase L1-like esterase